jgi:hypothetical protein
MPYNQKFHFDKASLSCLSGKDTKSLSLIETSLQANQAVDGDNLDEFDKYGMQSHGCFGIEFWVGCEAVKRNTTAVLRVTEDGKCSAFNILITQKMTEEYTTEERKTKIFYWQYLVVGVPIYDDLGLYPTHLLKLKNMKLFIARSFRKYCCSYILTYASTKEEAKEIIDEKLMARNQFAGNSYLLEEIICEKKAVVLE